ncbi:DUF2189 domain-containing protein [Bauldia sp.]|uniref:DUF2189 domain-containing protein n=1 Tax=Bauldia sp. TaxID=2575872 RepID=UPI003BACB04B
MAAQHTLANAGSDVDLPVVRRIGVADLRAALVAGYADFAARPTHIVFLGLIYPLIGLVLTRLVFGYDILPLLFPLAAGFVLIGPLAALGLYELSRRREAGLDVRLRHAFDVLRSPSIGAIAALAGLLLVIFFVWIAAADAIYVAAFGHAPAASMSGFLSQVFQTSEGVMLIILGNGIGFLFALLVLVLTVVSFPLLLDRQVSPAVAILTSVRAVVANPGPMALWGLIVAGLLVLGSIPLFLGLAIVVPVLGHATWHLYRRVVEPVAH